MSAPAPAFTGQGYFAAAGLLGAAAATLDAPHRRLVSEAAVDFVKVLSPTGTPKPWSPVDTPYMVEPMNELESRRFQELVFVGPAQSGKTQGLIDCWIAYVAICSPGDMMVVQATQGVARDFERDRWRKLLRHSSATGAACTGPALTAASTS